MGKLWGNACNGSWALESFAHYLGSHAVMTLVTWRHSLKDIQLVNYLIIITVLSALLSFLL